MGAGTVKVREDKIRGEVPLLGGSATGYGILDSKGGVTIGAETNTPIAVYGRFRVRLANILKPYLPEIRLPVAPTAPCNSRPEGCR